MLFALEQRRRARHPDTYAVAAIVGAFVLAAVLLGYVIAMGQPIPIALALGVVAGVALLNALPLVVWTTLVGVLVISGPVMMFVPALEKANWLFALLGFFLTGAAALYPATSRQRFARPLPPFVVLAIILFAFGLLSLAYSDGPLSEGVRAGKRYFQFFGLLLILAVVPFPAALVKRWWTFLIALAYIQLPFAIYQRFVLVPSLRGKPGVYELDIVVGTMEGSLGGGGSSSVMVLLLTLAIAYLLAAYREGVLPMRRLVPLLLLAAAPLPLGEVTLIVVLLPLALFAVYADLIARRPVRFVVGALFALPLMALTGWIYLAINLEAGQSLDKLIEAVIAYNFGDTPYFGTGLNRTSVYTYWFQNQGHADPVALFFGHGLGSSFGGVNEPNPGHMDIQHSRMYIGLTAASSVLWDLGIVGFALLMGLLLSGARCAWTLARRAGAGFDRAFCRALLALALMLLLMPFYSNSLISVPSQEVFMALGLGLIAWRWRITGQPGASGSVSHAR